MDPIVQETVRGLEKLAETRLSVVAHALTGVLDGLAKVSKMRFALLKIEKLTLRFVAFASP
jgi:hypothetical protein